ncbi:MAG: TetR/AcrR family transcriptional regulator [Bauldia sp.]
MSRRPSAYDPTRSLALLWGARNRPGRSGLSATGIIEAAIALADEEGLEALSMRRLAERLGVGTMALYTHVPGRAELIDLMIDRVYSELYSDPQSLPVEQPGTWREQLAYVAANNRAMFRRHPWMTQAVVRPAIGPNLIRKYDAELAPLDGIGLTDVEMDAALTLVLTHVGGVESMRIGLEHERVGLSDGEWWQAHEPALLQGWQSDRFPLAGRIGAAASEAAGGLIDLDLTYGFGLDRIIDGIELLLVRRR